MDKEFETVNTTTRFAHGPGTEDITIDYFDEKRFEVRGKDIAGPLIIAMDASLDPDVPKGARLLVNARQTEVTNAESMYSGEPTDAKALTLPLLNRWKMAPFGTCTIKPIRKFLRIFLDWNLSAACGKSRC